MITIALSKGRILEQTLPLLEKLNLSLAEDPKTSRKLRIPTVDKAVDVLIIRPTDVPTYVAYGAADIGITGNDILMEYEGDSLYSPVDLNIAKCRLMVAGFPDSEDKAKNSHARLRIATKYVNITRKYYAKKGEQVEIIKLYGSMELAPLVGLADYIVDLVDTGNTLKANGLVEKELIAHISSRLIINKAALKMKSSQIKALIQQFEQVA